MHLQIDVSRNAPFSNGGGKIFEYDISECIQYFLEIILIESAYMFVQSLSIEYADLAYQSTYRWTMHRNFDIKRVFWFYLGGKWNPEEDIFIKFSNYEHWTSEFCSFSIFFISYILSEGTPENITFPVWGTIDTVMKKYLFLYPLDK